MIFTHEAGRQNGRMKWHEIYVCLLSLLSILVLSTASVGNHLPFAGSNPIPKITPEPIDIEISQVKNITTSPLRLYAGLAEKVQIKNSGHTVKINLNQTTTGTLLTGGVLYNDVYVYQLCKFYWTTDLNETAGTTVNGAHGTRLEIGLFYYNTKYDSFQSALKYRDGLAEIIVRINVGSAINPLYYPFERKLQKVINAGDTTNTITAIVFLWYAFFPINANYFAYPGSYLNETSSELHYCTTTIVVPLYSYHFISEKQFNDTFGSFLRYDGDPLMNKRRQYPLGGRPVVQSHGVLAFPNSGLNPAINKPSYLKPGMHS